MNKQKISMVVLAILIVFAATAVFAPGLTKAGSLEPTDPPGPTMKTLDEIPPTWSRLLWGRDRFELVMEGHAVLDKETGLVWASNANIIGRSLTWEEAMKHCRNLAIGWRKGWRLPTVAELSSLMDYARYNPVLSEGYSSFFDNLPNFPFYWSSTTCEDTDYTAWYVNFQNGAVSCGATASLKNYVWPVRGGSGPILVPHTPSITQSE